MRAIMPPASTAAARTKLPTRHAVSPMPVGKVARPKRNAAGPANGERDESPAETAIGPQATDRLTVDLCEVLAGKRNPFPQGLLGIAVDPRHPRLPRPAGAKSPPLIADRSSLIILFFSSLITHHSSLLLDSPPH